ncbi:MAG: signal peptide peptidase SppA [Deltaproteobacteria bacterium]|nr:signal peptide peptidase SppA [Deltaproteobacteria bacterium]
MLRPLFALVINLLYNTLVLPLWLLRRLRRRYWLHLTLDGPLRQRATSRRFRRRGLTVDRVQDLVDRALIDNKVIGVLLTIRSISAGPTTIDALREQLARLKDRKPLEVCLETGEMAAYRLASIADRLAVPLGVLLDLRGHYLEVRFYGDLLARYGIDLQIGQAGRYKSAAERLTRGTISDANREALERLLTLAHRHSIEQISTARKLSQETVADLLNDGPYDVELAEQRGLIDSIEDEQSWLERLGDGRPARRIVAQRYLRWVRPKWFSLFRKKLIAIVSLRGAIRSGYSRQFPSPQIGDVSLRKLFDQLARLRRVAGVVLHIDSPGGGVTPSELIYQALCRLRKKKPVYAAFGDVAASGGYYIACGCDRLVCSAMTLTGSIGVLAGKLSLQRLLRRLGIGSFAIRRGDRSGMFGSSAPLNASERAALERLLRTTYQRFLERVAQARRLPVAEVDDIAQGRVWAGCDAEQHGLVDQLGGLSAAITAMQQQLRPRGAKLRVVDVFPPVKPSGLLSLLAAGYAPEFDFGAGGLLWDALELAKERLWFYSPWHLDRRDL